MSFIRELKRRNVFRVGIAYVVVAWLILQLSDVLISMLDLPGWIGRGVIFVLLVGFPLAIILAWAFELTPDGIKRDRDVDRGDTRATVIGRKLDFVIIGALILALGYFVWERQQLSPPGISIDRSIAVLPFVVRSTDVEQELFADGLTEEILNSLARTPDLKVASSTSSFAFKDSVENVRTIAESLGVSHVLEGSVRRSGERLRIAARLIRASDGFDLWSDQYDRQFADVIEIQEDIAIQIANALETAMDPVALAAMVSAGTHSVPAFEAYLKGLALATRARTSGDTSLMIDVEKEYRRAVDYDPEFSLAQYQMASFWRTQVLRNDPMSIVTDMSTEEMQEQYYEAIDQAIEHEKDVAVKTRYSAYRSLHDLEYRKALRQFNDYLELRPGDDEAAADRINLMRRLGMHEEGIRLGLKHIEGDIKENRTAYQVLQTLYYSGNRDAIVSAVREIIDQVPDDAFALYQAHKAFLWAMDVDSARAVLPKYLASKYPETNKALAQLRQACAESRRTDALRFHAELLEISDRLAVIWLAHMIIGDDDAANRLLQKYDEQRRFIELAALLHYGEFDPTNLPNLMARLAGQGIEERQTFEIPFRCNR
jgi:TolB-like protein